MTTKKMMVETPVSWQVDEIAVNATLTHPGLEGKLPAVILVAGSGPTDRDWNTPLLPGTNGSAALLAQALNESGYITLRYDKRASGPQAYENVMRMQGKISMQGHRDELAGGVKLLADHPGVDARQIYVLTNSEGCLHALNYQTQSPDVPFAGMILTSAPARPISVVCRMQIVAQVAALPEGDMLMSQFDQMAADFSTGREVKIDENLPEGIKLLFMGLSAPMNQPFSRELWMASAAQMLQEVTCPVLLVLGKKDIQVDWQADGTVFEEAARNKPNIQFAYLENANHILKFEPKPRVEINPVDASVHYNDADARLDPEAIEAITRWLKAL